MRFTIHDDEVGPFLKLKKNGGLPRGHKLKRSETAVDDPGYIYESGKDRCVFLNGDNQCSIYSQRPLICRMYPIMWTETDDDPELRFHLDMACKLTHEVPIKVFEEQCHSQDAEQMVPKYGALDMDPEDSQYIDLNSTKHAVESAWLDE